MIPYKITHAVLITYSGKRFSVDIESKVFTKPVRKVKDMILDAFVKMVHHSTDSFVKIEVKTCNLIKTFQ